MKIGRALISGALACSFVLGGLSGASAADGDETTEYTGPGVVTETMTDAEAQASIADLPRNGPYDGFVPATPGGGAETNCIACVGGVKITTQKVSGPVSVNKKFVRYLTPAWAYSTGYTWSSATAVAATLTASIGVSAGAVADTLGVSKSRTQTYTIAVSIYSSKARLSKLGLYSDYKKYEVRSKTVMGGKDSGWKNATFYTPTANQYLIATYK